MESPIGVEVAPGKLLTRDFLLACFGRGTFFGSLAMVMPLLPLYVVSVGGSAAMTGVVIGVFTVSIIILSPFIGRASDERQRKGMMLLGSLVFFAASLLYNFAASVTLLLLVRLFHGLGMPTYNISSSAYAADIAPARRRGEAMGWYGLSQNVAMGITPALAMVIYHAYGFNVAFVVSAAVAAAAILFTFLLFEPPRVHERSTTARGHLFSRAAVFPSAVVGCLGVTYGTMLAFVPLFAIEHGVDNPGLYFTAWAVALTFARPVAGRLSDRFGRSVIIVPGLLFSTAAMWLLPSATSLIVLLASAAVYGLGFGIAQPALMALAIDRVSPESRGASMGTFNLAFDVGVGCGSALLGLVLQFSDYNAMFFVTGVLPLLGVAAIAWRVATGRLMGKRIGNISQ